MLLSRIHALLVPIDSLQIGKMRLRRGGSDVALIGYGNPTNDCLAAAELLQQVGCRACDALPRPVTPPAYPNSYPSRWAIAHSLRPHLTGLVQAGVSATVVDARFCKPLDTDMLRKLAREHPVVITVEEGSIGGFAAHVMQVRRGRTMCCVLPLARSPSFSPSAHALDTVLLHP